MNGWSISGSMKANHYWQSGNKIAFGSFNPFSGYVKNCYFPSNQFTVTKNETILTMRSRMSNTGYGVNTGCIAGIYTGKLSDSENQATYSISKSQYRKFKRCNYYGKLTLKADKIPENLTDVLFYINGILFRCMGSEQGVEGTPETYSTQMTVANISGSNGNFEYKISGTRNNNGRYLLTDGVNIYIHFLKTNYSNQAYMIPATGQMLNLVSFTLETSRELTDEELTALKADTNSDFIISGSAENISEADYNAVTTG